MYDDSHFTRDAATVSFHEDNGGVTVDEDGSASFDWDEIETVTVENPPHAEAFDSKEFYDISATVAKPIPQPYQYGEETVWLKKPRDELRKAAWSLENAPWTMDHPETGMVKDVSDVRGFWSNPRYIDLVDDLDADLRIPVNDEEAKDFLEQHSDVSVGFYNQIARTDEYDGVVGGEDAEDIELDGFQTSMLFDHCASVEVGRCPSSAGCGIDAPQHGHINAADESFIRGTRITDISDEADNTTSLMSQHGNTDAPQGIYVADGRWFAVGPDEHPDENTEWPDDAKFPVDSCQNVVDAWNLRGTGDISIEQSTLNDRIKRAAEALGCESEMPDTAEMDTADVAVSAKRYSICGSRKDVMDDRDSDCGCDAEDSDTKTELDMEINFDDLSTEAALAKVAAQNDGVEQRLDELREAEETAEVAREAADELDIDETTDLPDTVAMLKEQRDSLEERVAELQRPQMEEDAEFIAERTDRFGEDAGEVLDTIGEDADELAAKRELVEELTEEYDEQTANSDDGTDDAGSSGTSTSGKYAKTPW